MNRNEIGVYDLTQLHKDNSGVIMATLLVNNDPDNRFDCIVSADLQKTIWSNCDGKWDIPKLGMVKCTYIDMDGQPENPILVAIRSKHQPTVWPVKF